MLAGKALRAVTQITSKDLEEVVDVEGVVVLVVEVEGAEEDVVDMTVVKIESVVIMKGETTRIEDLDRTEEIKTVDTVEIKMAGIVEEIKMVGTVEEIKTVAIEVEIVAITEGGTVKETEVDTEVDAAVLVMDFAVITEVETTVSPSNDRLTRIFGLSLTNMA